MSEGVSRADIDAAGAYEELFVSALFGQWTAAVLEAAQVAPDQRVLDVACGTGVLAREATVLTKSTGSVAGLDPNAGMLVVAERLAPEIEWRQGVAESLPFPDESFDALRAPFELGDRKVLAALFEDSGIESVSIETLPGSARFPSIRTMVEADLRGWLPVMGVNLTEEKIEQVLQEAESDLSSFVNPEGLVEFEAPAQIVAGAKRE